jgi:hypothetical protein
MAGASPFRDDWHDCLRAHYTQVVRDAYVLRSAPEHNADTLRGVLLRAGFNDAEIDALFIRATMRADEVGADFVPPDFARAESAPLIVDAAPAPEVAVAEVEAADEDAAHAEPAPDPTADELTEPQTPPETPEPEPRQLSLF